MSVKDFDNIVYRKPFLHFRPNKIREFIGLDSEAYTSGEPFVFCTSTGKVITPDMIPGVFFSRRYRNKHFLVYNLKYDSGALLYHLPSINKDVLRVNQKVEYNGVRYDYIPHKRLRISKGKNGVSIWDIMPFYKTSLDAAARKYLGKSKTDPGTKEFEPEYVKENWKTITDYCINDAVLTRDLGNVLVKHLGKHGIIVSSLYSTASISLSYFKQHSKIITSWRYWQFNRELLRYAWESYKGGIFEVYRRGTVYAYEYDISSAYPSEIAGLIDISEAAVKHSARYERRAIYGFIRCKINNPDGKIIPSGVMKSGVRVYPAGEYYDTITKAEYDFMRTEKIQVKIIDAFWLFENRLRYPYKKVIDKLYKMKDHYKGKDDMMYSTTKTILNSFYGKFGQATEKPDGRFHAGIAWNPIFASVVTANLRVKMCKYRRRLKKTCIAIHTDSLLLTKKAPPAMLGSGLGKLEYKTKGKALIIMSGMYDLGDKTANRGIVRQKKRTWRNYLETHPDQRVFKYVSRDVISWIDAIRQRRPDLINKFVWRYKRINLNRELKRIWLDDVNAGDLLSRLYDSVPQIFYTPEEPERWRKHEQSEDWLFLV